VAAAPALLPIGHRLGGRYQIVAPPWRGGMAVVYPAVDVATGEACAIKSPLPELAWDERALRRFEAEVGVWLELPRDPHLVTAFQVLIERDHPHLVMEYVDGGSLADRLRRAGGRLGEAEAVDYAFQICAGMTAASRGGEVSHLDLKPANLLLTRDGVLKVSDFGIARVTREFSGHRVRTRAGTPAYMAPEQLLGETVDVRCDLFAFGVIFHEMLTGRLPHPLRLNGDGEVDVERLALCHRLLRHQEPLTRQVAIDHEIDHDAVATGLALSRLDSYTNALSLLVLQELSGPAATIIAECLVSYPTEGRFGDFDRLARALRNAYPGRQPPRLAAGAPAPEDEWFAKAVSYQRLGEPEQALRYLNRVLARRPDHAEAWARAASAFFDLGHGETARELLRKAHRLAPDDPRIAEMLARLERELPAGGGSTT
jgi:serine/threonine protein kinase